MKASSLWFLGTLTISVPYLIAHLKDNNIVQGHFGYLDLIALFIGAAGYFVITRTIDRRWKLVRK